MKKLVICFAGLILACIAFNACSNSVTYAELLDDEKKSISNFIKDHDIKVITQKEFQDAGCVTDVSKNEYVQTTSGVYMQIIDKGSENMGDTIRNNDMVLVRYAEYRLEKDSTEEQFVMSNLSTDLFGGCLPLPEIWNQCEWTFQFWHDVSSLSKSNGSPRLADSFQLCERWSSCKADCAIKDGA